MRAYQDTPTNLADVALITYRGDAALVALARHLDRIVAVLAHPKETAHA